jgi:hypothetical protein
MRLQRTLPGRVAFGLSVLVGLYLAVYVGIMIWLFGSSGGFGPPG